MVQHVKNLSLTFQDAVAITKLESKEHTLKRRHYCNKTEEEDWFSVFSWKIKEHRYIKKRTKCLYQLPRVFFPSGANKLTDWTSTTAKNIINVFIKNID